MSYIGNEPIVSATRTVTEITATAGQTVFTANGGYTVGYIDVFVNGAQLQSADFTATNGSTVVLTQAAQVGDVVRLVAWGTFSSANITSGSLSAGGITWSQSGGVTLPRIDSSNEGGQLNFNRASDNTATWSIDSFGNTSTPALRFIDGANVRAVIDGSGNVGIGTSSPAALLSFGSTASGSVDGARIYLRNNTNEFAIGTNGSQTVYAGFQGHVWQTGSFGGTERMRLTTGGDLQFNSGYGSVATAFGCRAWVEFNGTGTVAIRASGNVSSITDNGTGDYTVNFATAMPDANYSIVGTGSDHGSWGSLFHTAANAGGGGTNPTTSNCRVLLSNNSGTSRVDDGFVNVAVFR